MIVFCHRITPRLQYAVRLAGLIMRCQEIRLTDSLPTFWSYPGARVYYGESAEGGACYHIRPHSLLFENNIRDVPVTGGAVEGLPILFPTHDDQGFDVFSALFYLVSRYEEYARHEEDEYGRYPYRASIAFRQGFLDRPLVNEWLQVLKERLAGRFPAEIWLPSHPFEVLPTYDIDEAWSYRYKKIHISVGGMAKDMLKGKFRRVYERWEVRRGKRWDPFDSYAWMDQLHEEYRLSPRYFFLVAHRRSRYDRNIHPSVDPFRELIREHARKYSVGIHPSWQSTDPGILAAEVATLSEITGEKVLTSRQHYIRFSLPQSYRRLIDEGIEEEFSMGYGSVNGFRASIGSSFNWYDLEKDEETSLKVRPFCFMDANSFFEKRQTAGEAVKEMRLYYDKVKNVNGCFISIWHNTFLGTDPLFSGWREAYHNFWKTI